MFQSNLFNLGGGDGGGDDAKGRSAQARQTDAMLRGLILDEEVMVITSFDLNKVATLTYHESSMMTTGDDLCELIFEVLASVLSQPARCTPLTLEKALVVAYHVLVFGAESVVHEGAVLGRHVEALLQYNTVLLAQQQPTSAASIFLRIKGGGVDKGGPVREKAKKVYELLCSADKLRFERNSQADPNSLVPVGDCNKAAFVSDEVRLHALKKRMEQQERIQVRSNLAKADNGFGAGYNAVDGKSVVGAAHGIDEMMRLAQAKERKEKMKFSDDPASAPATPGSPQREPFQSYVAPSFATSPTAKQQEQQQHADLLSLDDPGTTTAVAGPQQAEADLLDFGSGGLPPTSTNNASSYSHDLLGDIAATTAGSSASGGGDVFSAAASDLLCSLSSSSLPVAVTAGTPTSPGHDNGLLGNSSCRSRPGHQSLSSSNRPIMSNGAGAGGPGTLGDPFGAFDALSVTTSPTKTATPSINSSMTDSVNLDLVPQQQTSSTASAAESRILGGFASSSVTTNDSTASVGSFATASYQQSNMSAMPFHHNSAGSGLKVASQILGIGSDEDNGDDNGFIMGGTTGSGLEPVGAAPAAAPPPPPAFY